MTVRFNATLLARVLVILALVTLMRSPALANLFLALLLLTILASGTVRGRIRASLQQPMAMGVALFLLALAIGTLYSAAGWRAGVAQLWAWRPLLFMIIVAALFDAPRWKLVALRVFAGVTTIGAAAVILLSLQQTLASGQSTPVPIALFRNYATQGMTFTAALIACGSLAQIERRRLRTLWLACAVLLLVATTVVTEGRSGYVVLLASAATFALGTLLARGISPTRALVSTLAILTLGVALVGASPVARQRIDLALIEMRDYQAQGQVSTSMGLRMYFWRDALTLISQHPVFGSGTGSYQKVQSELVANRSGAAGMQTTDPHNQYLKIAAENGLVGLGAFMVLLVTLARQRPSGPFRIAGLAVLAGWCATSLANSHFSTFQEGHLLGLFLGVTLASESGAAARET